MNGGTNGKRAKTESEVGRDYNEKDGPVDHYPPRFSPWPDMQRSKRGQDRRQEAGELQRHDGLEAVASLEGEGPRTQCSIQSN